MKKKLLSLLMVTALTASLVAGCGSNGDSKDKSSGSDRETKDVSELVIGETEYSVIDDGGWAQSMHCLLYTSPSPRDAHESRMPSSA